jgi:hypothetical protein
MRPTLLVPLLAAAVALLVLLVEPGSPPSAPAGTPPAGGAAAERGVTGKPNPHLGFLQIEAVERPSPDRAWVRAIWTRAEGAHGCRLDVIVPEGATLLSGEPSVTIVDDAQAGEASWLVDFPLGRDLDLTVRLCGTNERGDEAMEAYLRLTSAP